MSAHCLFCGGDLAADRSCELCGIRRVSRDEKRVGAPCPRCESTRLGLLEIGPAVVQGCTSCRGMFVATTEWDAILDYTKDKPLPDEVVLRRAVGESSASDGEERAHPYRAAGDGVDSRSAPRAIDLGAPVSCPVCAREADRVEFAGVSRILVDVCAAHGIWLDAGELAMVVARTRRNMPAFGPETEAVAFAQAEKEPHDSRERFMLFLSALFR